MGKTRMQGVTRWRLPPETWRIAFANPWSAVPLDNFVGIIGIEGHVNFGITFGCVVRLKCFGLMRVLEMILMHMASSSFDMNLFYDFHDLAGLTSIDWIKEDTLYFSEIGYGFKDYILGFPIRGAHVPF